MNDAADAEALSSRISSLEKALRSEAKRSQSTARLMSMPGMGPITAVAVEAFAPTMGTFRRGRDFAAWLGLVPKQHSSGGKQVLGRTSKMGQRDIRRLLIIGAMTVIRWACRKAPPENSWLAHMLTRKPRMLVAIALANKMARSIWAMMTKNEDYKDFRSGCGAIKHRAAARTDRRRVRRSANVKAKDR